MRREAAAMRRALFRLRRARAAEMAGITEAVMATIREEGRL